MKITGDQSGNELTIVVKFDEPAQVKIFNDHFLEMLKKMASEQDTKVINVMGKEINDSDDATVPKHDNNFINKFIN